MMSFMRGQGIGYCLAMMVAISDCLAQPEDQHPAGTPDLSQDYVLVWADEFDGGDAPSPVNWNIETGFADGAALQYNQPENARVEDGKLIIEAKREARRNPYYSPNSPLPRHNREFSEYTSAASSTLGRRAWRNGRFEIRARIPVGGGLWPSLLAFGILDSWPHNGEAAVMQYYQGALRADFAWGGKDRKSRIAPSDPVPSPIWKRQDLSLEQLGGVSWANEFHVWRMDWDEKRVQLFVDGRLLNEIDVRSAANTDVWQREPFRYPHYLALGLAVGGKGGGLPGAGIFPARMEVDYVRVYQRPHQMAHETLELKEGMAYADALLVVAAAGGMDITPGTTLVTRRPDGINEWPSHGYYWRFPAYDCVVSVRDSKEGVLLQYWNQAGFSESLMSRNFSVQQPQSVKFDPVGRKIELILPSRVPKNTTPSPPSQEGE